MNYYLDSSAILKFILDESESRSLRKLHIDDAYSSDIARLEVRRTLDRLDSADGTPAKEALEMIHFVELSETVLSIAESFRGLPMLRSLDAIHLASATIVKSKIKAIITYDHDMATAAELLGFEVVAPK